MHKTTIFQHICFFGIPKAADIEEIRYEPHICLNPTVVFIGYEPLVIRELIRLINKKRISDNILIVLDEDEVSEKQDDREKILQARDEVGKLQRVTLMTPQGLNKTCCSQIEPLDKRLLIIAKPDEDGILTAVRAAGFQYADMQKDAETLTCGNVKPLSTWGERLRYLMILIQDNGLRQIDYFIRSVEAMYMLDNRVSEGRERVEDALTIREKAKQDIAPGIFLLTEKDTFFEEEAIQRGFAMIPGCRVGVLHIDSDSLSIHYVCYVDDMDFDIPSDTTDVFHHGKMIVFHDDSWERYALPVLKEL